MEEYFNREDGLELAKAIVRGDVFGNTLLAKSLISYAEDLESAENYLRSLRGGL